MTNLSVNINKVATIRNARGGNVPNVLKVALDCEAFGAQGITVHPRPDERHIRYSDVYARPIVELGCGNAIVGVLDAQYFKTPEVVAGLKSGKISDCGSSIAGRLLIEKVVIGPSLGSWSVTEIDRLVVSHTLVR